MTSIRTSLWSATLLLIAAMHCYAHAVDGVNTTIECSLVELIVQPERFDGKRIVTQGIAVIEFEGNAVYLSSESADHGAAMNGIRLRLKNDKALEHLNMKWIFVSGTFHMRRFENEQFKGTIDNITHIYALDKS